MPTVPRFRNELVGIAGIHVERKCFRLVSLWSYEHSDTRSLLYDGGPKNNKKGWRFSPPNEHCGLYMSLDLPTAGAEFSEGMVNWQNGENRDFVKFTAMVLLGNVLNLCDDSVLMSLGTTKDEIHSSYYRYDNTEWPPTWILGHEVFACGRFDGIQYPSKQNPDGTCILIFTERLVHEKTSVTVCTPEGAIWEKLPGKMNRQVSFDP